MNVLTIAKRVEDCELWRVRFDHRNTRRRLVDLQRARFDHRNPCRMLIVVCGVRFHHHIV